MRRQSFLVPSLLLACTPAAAPNLDPGAVFVREGELQPQWRQADAFQIRGDSKLGCRNLQLNEVSLSHADNCATDDFGDELGPLTRPDRGVQLHANTDGFVRMPRLQSKFLIDDGPDRLVAFTVSMLGITSEQGADEPVQIRVRVDGQVVADPGPVTFWERRSDVPRATPRAFTFFTEAGPGLHVVEVERSSGDTNVWLHEQSLRVDVQRYEDSELPGLPPQASGLFGSTANIDDTIELAPEWEDIPGAVLDFESADEDEILLMLSPVFDAEGAAISMRAVIDGEEALAYPSRHTVDADEEGSPHAVLSTAPRLEPGLHQVQWQWASHGKSEIHLESLSTFALSGPENGPDFVVRAEEQTATMHLVWEDSFEQHDGEWFVVDPFRAVPGLSTVVELDEIADAAITLTADLSGDRQVFAAPTVNGVPLADQQVLLLPVAPSDNGARTYTFAVKDLPTGDVELGIAVRSTEGNAEGESILNHAAMGVLVKRRVGPDLAVGARAGTSAMKYETPIEPVIGDTPLLPILFDAERDDIPSTAGFAAVADTLLFGPDPSVANFYEAMSSGRATLSAASPLLVYTGSKPGGDNSTNYYWDDAEFDCDANALYKSAANARWALALRAAEADGFPFADYDRDRNGVLTSDELSIVIFQPDDSNNGSSAVAAFRPYCNGGEFVADGVRIRTFAQVNTPVATTPLAIADGFVGTTVHELGHTRLRLDDVYMPYRGTFDPVSGDFTPNAAGELRTMNTDPAPLSLMSSGSNRLAQLDAYQKLHLGWATPRIPESDGHLFQPNVADSDLVTVLPRRGTDAREYFVLESRNSTPGYTPAYDTWISAQGMAVFHVLEPSDACLAGDDANCLLLDAPPCVPDTMWARHSDNYIRTGLRLVQPDLTHSAGENLVVFNNVNPDILDEAPGGGPSCPAPAQLGEVGGEGHLLWSDESASGYQAAGLTHNSAVGTDLELTVP